MRLPRDVSGEDLAHLLKRFGYEVTRQTGSHMRLARIAASEQRLTVPGHETLKVGTLNAILKDVADQLHMEKEDLIRQLWGTGRQ